MGDGVGVVAMSAGHEYVGGTPGLGTVSNAADVLWMREDGVVCDICMCLGRGVV